MSGVRRYAASGLQAVAGFADDLVFLVAPSCPQEGSHQVVVVNDEDLRRVLAHDVLLVFASGVQRSVACARVCAVAAGTLGVIEARSAAEQLFRIASGMAMPEATRNSQ